MKRIQKMMVIARYLVNNCKYTMQNAMRLGWRVLSVKEGMTFGIVDFSYHKKDGTIREARGTVNLDYIPGGVTSFAGETHHLNEGVIRYYDIDSKGWRSFKIENLI